MPWPRYVPVGTRVTKLFGDSWFSGAVTGFHARDLDGTKQPLCKCAVSSVRRPHPATSADPAAMACCAGRKVLFDDGQSLQVRMDSCRPEKKKKKKKKKKPKKPAAKLPKKQQPAAGAKRPYVNPKEQPKASPGPGRPPKGSNGRAKVWDPVGGGYVSDDDTPPVKKKAKTASTTKHAPKPAKVDGTVYRGVSATALADGSARYHAVIWDKGIKANINLGTFQTAEHAAREYDAASVRMRGKKVAEDHGLNFPGERIRKRKGMVEKSASKHGLTLRGNATKSNRAAAAKAPGKVAGKAKPPAKAVAKRAGGKPRAHTPAVWPAGAGGWGVGDRCDARNRFGAIFRDF